MAPGVHQQPPTRRLASRSRGPSVVTAHWPCGEAWHHARDRVHGAAQPISAPSVVTSSAVSRGESARCLQARAAWRSPWWSRPRSSTPLSIRAVNRVVVGDAARASATCRRSSCSREHRRVRSSADRRTCATASRRGCSSATRCWARASTRSTSARSPPRTTRSCAFLYHPATGPGVVVPAPSRTTWSPRACKPRAVFVFFRDTNLTDTLFRAREPLRQRARRGRARRTSPSSNALVAARKRGVWSRVHTAAVRAYQTDVATGWLEPAIRRWFVNWRYPDAGGARCASTSRSNERFDLANLRARRRRRSVRRQRVAPTSPATCRRRCCR